MNDPLLYADTNSLTKNAVNAVLERHRMSFQWNEGERILDVGCGPGDTTSIILLPFLPKDSFVVGCDISEEMVKFGSEFYENDRIKFKMLDIEEKTVNELWERESFTKIYSFFCLHWIHDLRQAAGNIYWLLKPSGETMLAFLTPDYPFNRVTKKLKSSKKWEKFMKAVTWFYDTDNPPSFFNAILEEAGFEKIRCYLRKNSYCFPSANALMDLVRSVDPYLHHIPVELQSSFLEEYEDLLMHEECVSCVGTDGEILLEYDLMVALAKKPEQQQ